MNSFFKVTVFALIDIISSCSLPKANLHEITDRYSNEKSAAFENLKITYDKEKTKNYFDQLFRSIEENSSFASNDSAFINNFNNLMTSIYSVIDGITISRTKYFDSADEEYKNKYLYYYQEYLDVLSQYHDLLEAAHHSNYKSMLFAGLSDNEIRELIDSFETSAEEQEYTLKFKDYNNEAEEIYSKYYQSSDYEDRMYDLLVKYMKTAKEYASYLGEDYLDYTYEHEYLRNYTTKDTADFYEAVKNDLIPATKSYKDKVTSLSLTPSEMSYMDSFTTYNFRYYENHMIAPIEEYVYSVDPLSRAYKNLWSKNGVYCFSNKDNSLGTAFTGYLRGKQQPLLFFSRDYQNVFTFIHEFGHYTAFYVQDGKNFPMDINEIESQANELLFASFLKENYENFDLSENVVNYINAMQLYGQLNSIINCSYASEMEQIAYNYDLSDKQGFFRKIDEIHYKYGDLAVKKYWWAPVLCSFGYYISYATSSIGALQFYIDSRSSYSDAINKYSKFLQRNSYLETIDDITDSIGLMQIYSDEAVKYIADFVRKQ